MGSSTGTVRARASVLRKWSWMSRETIKEEGKRYEWPASNEDSGIRSCPGSSGVKRAPRWHQDGGKSLHLPPETKKHVFSNHTLNKNRLALRWHLIGIYFWCFGFLEEMLLSWFLLFGVCTHGWCTYCKLHVEATLPRECPLLLWEIPSF